MKTTMMKITIRTTSTNTAMTIPAMEDEDKDPVSERGVRKEGGEGWRERGVRKGGGRVVCIFTIGFI